MRYAKCAFCGCYFSPADDSKTKHMPGKGRVHRYCWLNEVTGSYSRFWRAKYRRTYGTSGPVKGIDVKA